MAFLACQNVTSEDVGTIWLPNQEIINTQQLLFDGNSHCWRRIPNNPAFVIEVGIPYITYTVLIDGYLHVLQAREDDFLYCYGRLTIDTTNA